MTNPTFASIDVVVVTWNNAEMLLDCLEHLARAGTPHRLIVVDNASADDTVYRVRKRFPEAELIEMKENVGFGRAANRGIERATGDFVFLLNNDANIEPEFLEKLLEPFRDRRVGMVGGVLVNPATGRVDTAGIQIDTGLGGYSALCGKELSTVEAELEYLVGPALGAAVIRRSTLDAIGLFDEGLFAYSEDVDLVLRARLAGWRFVVVADARASHVGSATLGVRSRGAVALAAHSRGYMAGRYRVGLIWLLTEFLVGTVDSLRLRSRDPLAQRVSGWRDGRALPGRQVPEDLPRLRWPTAMKLRLKAM